MSSLSMSLQKVDSMSPHRWHRNITPCWNLLSFKEPCCVDTIPSHCLVTAWLCVRSWKREGGGWGVTSPDPNIPAHPRTGPAERPLPSSSLERRCCIVNSLVFWKLRSLQISRGQLMSGPWPSDPNYGFERTSLCAPQTPGSVCVIIV